MMNHSARRKRILSFVSGAIAGGLLFWVGVLPHSQLSPSMSFSRMPAQSASGVDPFILHYLNPRQGCAADLSSCGQANECCSLLCLKGACVPRYFSNEKAYPGEACISREECFSNVCDTVAHVCVGSKTGLCAYVAQYCNADTQCCSGSCDTTTKQCVGDSVKECAPVGADCGSTGECCSGICGDNKCMGSDLDPAAVGELCNADGQCLSNICRKGKNTASLGRCL
jgi:hypothetical protein